MLAAFGCTKQSALPNGFVGSFRIVASFRIRCGLRATVRIEENLRALILHLACSIRKFAVELFVEARQRDGRVLASSPSGYL